MYVGKHQWERHHRCAKPEARKGIRRASITATKHIRRRSDRGETFRRVEDE